MNKFFYTLGLWCGVFLAIAQKGNLTVAVSDAVTREKLAGASVLVGKKINGNTNEEGVVVFYHLPYGTYTLTAELVGYSKVTQSFVFDENHTALEIHLDTAWMQTDVVNIEKQRKLRLEGVEGSDIYEGKKNDVIVMKDLNANMATGNSRQVFARVSGINVWESDAGGLQLGIGARGLNPNRASEFNIRQNGYDITADALGYPDAYYTPPLEAVDRIEIIRGAASLQYGTQFGGLVNYVLKSPALTRKCMLTSQSTLGSYGLMNFFNSLEGTKGKWAYYSFYQFKSAKGWRPNTHLQAHNAYALVSWTPRERLKIDFEYSLFNYLMKQPGGLTDRQFEDDPSLSFRDRNWFSVSWNIPAVVLNYALNKRNKINMRTFGLIGSRNALGFLGFVNRVDDNRERNLIKDQYLNIGSEVRWLHRYGLTKDSCDMVVGVRYFYGNTNKKQGLGTAGTDANFDFLNPENLEASDFTFPNRNLAFFWENIFRLSSKFSLTPGVRIEYINTKSSGYYKENNLRFTDTTQRERFFPLYGLGLSYKPKEWMEVYANYSRNYRAINFTDLRVVNPNTRIDLNIKDEKGYNADLGLRGRWKNRVNYDVNIFYLSYTDRIGTVQKIDSLFNIYRFRTNISDSRSVGLESFIEWEVWKTLFPKSDLGISLFSNISFVDARYVRSENTAIDQKFVEYAPRSMWRQGAIVRYKGFSATLQRAFVSEQFSDATNAVFSSTAVIGVIPAYEIWDFSAKYSYKKIRIAAGINNFTNSIYFTRRAESYPGPGIIPADPRTFYLSVGFKL